MNPGRIAAAIANLSLEERMKLSKLAEAENLTKALDMVDPANNKGFFEKPQSRRPYTMKDAHADQKKLDARRKKNKVARKTRKAQRK